MDENTSMIPENEITGQAEEASVAQAEETAKDSGAGVASAEGTSAAEEPVVVQKLSRKEKKQLKKAQKKEKKIQKKLAKKERKKRWKETKKEDRRKLKEHYKDAPWFIRIPRLALRPMVKVILWGMLAAIIIGLGVGIFQGVKFLKLFNAYIHQYDPVSREQIDEIAPYDTEGAERIAAYPGVNPDETWTICIYMVGADLEDCDEDDLSQTTRMQIANEKYARDQAALDYYYGNLDTYADDLGKNNLPLPEFLYYPEKPIARSEYVINETIVAGQGTGAASEDIVEMLTADLSDNITIVIQTGGATRWENTFINPNKTQRFVITKDRYFEEVSNLPLQRATDPNTLSDFLKFCKDDYPADHTMLVLWDHGGGPFGYGKDSVYGGVNMSMKDVNQALSNVYTPNPENPAFDIIGFDACLMSSLEVTHALNGYASFFAVSEESEPGEGWNYTDFLNMMSEDPTMSPASVAQAIADTYIDYYMRHNINVGSIGYMHNVTFAVLDAGKTEELYLAYSALTRQQLKDAAEDISVLAEIGRCSNNSPHMAAEVFDVYNLVDLGCYVDLMIDTYPEECSNIKNLLNEAVIYHRENGSLSDTQGISVYIPGSISSYSGLKFFLRYEYDICEDPYTRALYFYKISGCLNDEMLETVKTLTDVKPQVLDISQFTAFEKEMPEIDGNNFSIAVSGTLQPMIQAYDFELALYDEENGRIIYYGQDEYVYLDGEGNLVSEFDGEWVFLDGQPLALEITSKTISSVEYRSHVRYNGSDAYLLFAYDRDTEEFEIKGIRLFPDDGDQINFTVNSKSNVVLQPKDTIVPVYPTTDFNGMTSEIEGEKITYQATSSIVMKGLPSGYYLAMANIYDQRGDSYSSKVIGYVISGGKIKECELNPDFVGTDY